MMIEKIERMIEAMTTDEMKQRLAEYMAADPQLVPRPIALKLDPPTSTTLGVATTCCLLLRTGKKRR